MNDTNMEILRKIRNGIEEMISNNFYSFKIESKFHDILSFNERVLTMAEDGYVCGKPIESIARLEFVKIVMSNLLEFISVRLPTVDSDELPAFYRHIQAILKDMCNIVEKITQSDINVEIATFIFKRSRYLTSDIKVHRSKLPFPSDVYIVGSHGSLIQANQIYGFDSSTDVLIRLIGDKSKRYLYNNESTRQVLSDIENAISIQEIQPPKYAIVSRPIKSKTLNAITLKNGPLDTIFEATPALFAISEIISILEKKEEKHTSPIRYRIKKEPFKLSVLSERDVLIHTPYDSYDTVLEFVDELASSSAVTSIFISLYRIAEDSKILESLLKAADSGKRVYVYIEVTARGDETANIGVVEKLLATPNVFVRCNYYTMKVHAKICLGISNDGIGYVHIGTGNYNEKTAAQYTDYHFLTSNRKIVQQVFSVFGILFAKQKMLDLTSAARSNAGNGPVYMSPGGIRDQILAKIAETASSNNKRIWMKCNSICYPKITEALESAALNGTEVKLLARTSSDIAPTKNIEVRSKVGKYLEHSRCYIFGDEVYISSADILSRNLDNRIEVMVRIDDPYITELIINDFSEEWCSLGIFKKTSKTTWVQLK